MWGIIGDILPHLGEISTLLGGFGGNFIRMALVQFLSGKFKLLLRYEFYVRIYICVVSEASVAYVWEVEMSDK